MNIDAPSAGRSPSSRAVKERIGAVLRARPYTLVAAVAIAALMLLVAGASAATKCDEPLGTSTFTDPTGDGSGAGAPDIVSVTASSYEYRGLDLTVSFSGVDKFGSDMIVRTYVDSDRNPATGDQDGYDYMIQTKPAAGADDALAYGLRSVKCEDQLQSSIFSWKDSAWTLEEGADLDSWFGDGGLHLRLKSDQIGNAVDFDLAVYAAAHVSYDQSGNPDLSAAVFDRAPNEGSYTYQPFQSSTYSDLSGDGNGDGAPDITAVRVTKWGDKRLKLSVSIPGVEEFADDMLVRIYFDSDNDASTGDATGYDYMIQAQKVGLDLGGSALVPNAVDVISRVLCEDANLTLFEWNGTSWSPADSDSVDWWYDEGLNVSLDPSAVGSPNAFAFAVYAATKVTFDSSGWPDLSQASYDRAPDAGSYAFPLTVGNAEVAGVYRVAYRITQSHNFGSLKRGQVLTKKWSIERSCKKKRCITSARVNGQAKYRLSRSGKTVYQAKAGRRYACSGSSTRATEKFTMNVKKSRWVAGKWRVTDWAGTLQVVRPGSQRCGGAASYTASLTARLK